MRSRSAHTTLFFLWFRVIIKTKKKEKKKKWERRPARERGRKVLKRTTPGSVGRRTRTWPMGGAGAPGPMSERVVKPVAPRPRPATYPAGAGTFAKVGAVLFLPAISCVFFFFLPDQKRERARAREVIRCTRATMILVFHPTN